MDLDLSRQIYLFPIMYELYIIARVAGETRVICMLYLAAVSWVGLSVLSQILHNLSQRQVMTC